MEIPNIIKEFCKDMELVYNGLNSVHKLNPPQERCHLIKYKFGTTMHNFVIKNNVINHSIHRLKRICYDMKNDKYKIIPDFIIGTLNNKTIQ